MGLDIRWPIGLMFSLIGVILVIYGLITSSNAEVYRRSLEQRQQFWAEAAAAIDWAEPWPFSWGESS